MATHGGKRPGAGRKKKAEKHGGAVAAAEKKISDNLPLLIDRMLFLAKGGYEQVEEEWAPAYDLADDDDGDDAELAAERAAERGALVMVKRKVSVAAPDRAAAQYLIDRVMGRPTERHEHAGEGGEPFKVYIGVDLERI